MWNHIVNYNESVLKRMRSQRLMVNELTDIHLCTLTWLSDNLQEGRDYAWSSTRNKNNGIVLDYIYFDKEEDVLAFRLACGL